jgi:hypothetical protein
MAVVSAVTCDHCGNSDLGSVGAPTGWFEVRHYHSELRGLPVELHACSAACVVGLGERFVVEGEDLSLTLTRRVD